MIRLANTPESVSITGVELFKIFACREVYPNDTLLWTQNGTDRIISMLDGDMVIYSSVPCDSELESFVRMLSPRSVFSDLATIKSLFGSGYTEACVMCKTDAAKGKFIRGDALKSDEIYGILCSAGLEMPPFEYFATDFCRRINRSHAFSFALRGKCAAISFHTQNTCLINGIASVKKGCGSLALNQLLIRENGKTAFACCTDDLCGFYRKNGFEFIYKTAYWKR